MIYLNKDCWFCNELNSVSIFKRNNWYCQKCTQYNGFTKDGDYNKEIPEMYKTTERNCLCENCNRNQEIILNKLSNYEAKTVSTNDLEIEMYRGYLDKLYNLQGDCKSKVKFEIRKQDGILKQYLYKIGNFEYFFENNNKMSRRIGGVENNEFEVKKKGKGRVFYLNIILL